jgi:holo-[acyl-carrier protein] synthase
MVPPYVCLHDIIPFMNNFGIGVDIESIERFVKLDRAKDSRFLAKIFTEKELDYCFKYKSPAEHLAVRYAGKEAVIKAMASINKTELVYRDIEILNDGNEVPRVSVKADYGDVEVHISLSHCEDKAVAFAMVTLK